MRKIKVVALLFLSLLLLGCGSPAEELACDGVSPKKELVELLASDQEELLARQTISEMEVVEAHKQSGDEHGLVCKATLALTSPFTGQVKHYPATYYLEKSDRSDADFKITIVDETAELFRVVGGLISNTPH